MSGPRQKGWVPGSEGAGGDPDVYGTPVGAQARTRLGQGRWARVLRERQAPRAHP